jgi:hypothetical protein
VGTLPAVSDSDEVEQKVVRVINEVGRRARGERLHGLADALRVEARFADDVGAATAHAGVPVHSRAGEVAAKATAPLLDHQRRYNEAVLDALHQLDHRFRWQDERIRQLELEVDELRARLQP